MSDFEAGFAAHIPQWKTWPRVKLVEQLGLYITAWDAGDPAGLVTAYQQLSALDPAAAGDGEVLNALVGVLAPKAAELARQGNIGAAAPQIAQAMAPYPTLKLAPLAVAKAIRAYVIGQEGASGG